MHSNLGLRRQQLTTSPAPVSVGRQLMPRGGSQRGQCSYDADCGCGDPPAFSDALEHGDPFVGLYVTIQYLHAGFKESVAQHCQTGAIKRRSLCHVLLESATHNLAKFWDALSGWSPWRKLRPGIHAQTGMSFPQDGPQAPPDPSLSHLYIDLDRFAENSISASTCAFKNLNSRQ